MKKLLFSFIAIFVLCFSANAQHLRADFLKGKSQEQIVSDFTKLSASDKNNLWIDKLDHLLSQNLPKEHEILITELKQLLKDNDRRTNQSRLFIEKSVRLAQITPYEDLIAMFESLQDYKFQGVFLGKTKTPQELIDDINNLNNSNPNLSEKSKVNCSCRWCLFTSGTKTNCLQTEDGCGWFGIQSCTHCLMC